VVERLQYYVEIPEEKVIGKLDEVLGKAESAKSLYLNYDWYLPDFYAAYPHFYSLSYWPVCHKKWYHCYHPAPASIHRLGCN